MLARCAQWPVNEHQLEQICFVTCSYADMLLLLLLPLAAGVL
jgi:hypothetical protein